MINTDAVSYVTMIETGAGRRCRSDASLDNSVSKSVKRLQKEEEKEKGEENERNGIPKNLTFR